jgi:hypothetical protein
MGMALFRRDRPILAPKDRRGNRKKGWIMAQRAANRKGRAYLLTADGKTLDLLREFGRRGFYEAECARRLDVCEDTYRKFKRREPAARQAFEAGAAERRELLLADPPGRAELPVLETPKSGETCPTCGGRVGYSDETVTFTTAELAEARRKFEDLIDRQLAEREAAAAEGDVE